MAKNYYVILGVPLDAAPDEIRSAYRKLAMRYHPDRQGESGPSAFQDISEAYGVLSDPSRRARYDHELRGRRQSEAFAPVSSRAHDPEPLISEPVDIVGQPETIRPSVEALLERLGRNFASLGTPKAEREEPLNFELIMSPEEAQRGVLVPIQVPVFSICFECGGMGRNWVFPCAECDGEGRTVYREEVNVRVPRGIRDGTVIEVSLKGLGIRNLWLRVRVRIERY
jgi:DnaJ-class molecular chaperone